MKAMDIAKLVALDQCGGLCDNCSVGDVQVYAVTEIGEAYDVQLMCSECGAFVFVRVRPSDIAAWHKMNR